MAQSPSNTQQTSGRSATVSGKTNVTKVEELIEIHVNYTIHGIAKATCISLSQIYLDAFYFEAHFASKKDFCQMDIAYMHIYTWPKTNSSANSRGINKFIPRLHVFVKIVTGEGKWILNFKLVRKMVNKTW